jgi:hypothetical protein
MIRQTHQQRWFVCSTLLRSAELDILTQILLVCQNFESFFSPLSESLCIAP